MKKFHLGILLSILSLVSLTSCNNQQEETSKVVLNEVLSLNKGNFQDDYGVHNAWIEVFNKSYGTVDIAGYKLAIYNGMGDTIFYNVPKGDVLTKINLANMPSFGLTDYLTAEPSTPLARWTLSEETG